MTATLWIDLEDGGTIKMTVSDYALLEMFGDRVYAREQYHTEGRAIQPVLGKITQKTLDELRKQS